MKKRPLGITILSCISFLGAAFYCVLALLATVDRTRLRSLLEGMSGGGTGPAPLLRMDAILPFYFVVMAAFTAVLGWGLWKLKNWVRLIVLVIIGLSVIGGAIEIIRAWPQSTMTGLVMALLRVAVAILIFSYLCRASVRAAFGPGAQPLTPAKS